MFWTRGGLAGTSKGKSCWYPLSNSWRFKVSLLRGAQLIAKGRALGEEAHSCPASLSPFVMEGCALWQPDVTEVTMRDSAWYANCTLHADIVIVTGKR